MKFENPNSQTTPALPAKVILLFFLFALPFVVSAQKATGDRFEKSAIASLFDTVFDRFGTKYAIAGLSVEKLHNTGSGSKSLATYSCIAGMFEVYFGPGSGMDLGQNAQHALRRQTICEVFENISGLLNYNASYPASARVRIAVLDVLPFTSPVSPASSAVLGLASSYYLLPLGNPAAASGITQNLIEQTIQKKADAWVDCYNPMGTINSGTFFHGFIAFNFANPTFQWNSSIANVATNSEFDLYTVALHEVTHALGFNSLINANASSVFGNSLNYFSEYDLKLNKKLGAGLSPLIVTGTNCSSKYPIAIQSNSAVLSPSCGTAYATDFTFCGSALVYEHSPTERIEVYTPGCFEQGSSLSHFEDMCYPVPSATNNNQIFTMSNAGSPGQNKRFLQEEERHVFCDLGYNVLSTYTSNAAGASKVYTSSACSGNRVWGRNDGILNSSFTFTSTGGPVVISIQGPGGIIANDYQGPNPIVNAICVETVYNNGFVTLSGNTIVFNPTSTSGGVFVLRYTPVNSAGEQGGITYVYGFIYPSFCGEVDPCDLVQNGGFENSSSCGSMPAGTSTISSCWLACTLSPDLFNRGCVASTIPANLGTNTYSSSTVFDSHSGAPNNACLGFGAYTAQGGTTMLLGESAANYLSSPVINGQVYTLSFWAYQFIGTKFDPAATNNGVPYVQTFNQDSVPVVMSFAVDSVFVPSQLSNMTFPYAPLASIKSITLQNVFNTWRHYSTTFTANCAAPSQWLFVGPDKVLSQALKIAMIGTGSNQLNYTLIDDVSLVPLSQTAQSSLPSKLCLGQTLSDLEQYVSIPGGVFSGQGITTSTLQTATGIKTIYHFNFSTNLPPGLYTINYTFTNNIGCSKSIYAQINIGSVFDGVGFAITSTTNCINSSTVAIVAPQGTYNFTWSPGSIIGNSIAVSPALPSIYTVSAAFNPSCQIIGTVLVNPSTTFFSIVNNSGQVCINSQCQLVAVGNFTSVNWQPGNYQSSVVNFVPVAPLVFTVNAIGAFGCTASQTISVVPLSLPNLIATASSTLVCSNQNVTLTANGAYSYLWQNSITQSSFVIAPQISNSYVVTGTGTNNCSSTKTIQVNVLTNSITVHNNTIICSGETATLSVTGSFNTYYWPGINQYIPSPTVSPVATTIYSVTTTQITAQNNCMRIGTVQIVVDPCTFNRLNAEEPIKIKIYPNPTDGQVFIENQTQENQAITLLDASGRIVLEQILEYDNSNRLLSLMLEPGFYFVCTKNDTFKLIVLK